jgi:hypothetical protein
MPLIYTTIFFVTQVILGSFLALLTLSKSLFAQNYQGVNALTVHTQSRDERLSKAIKTLPKQLDGDLEQ